jgi:hypothetical protein
VHDPVLLRISVVAEFLFCEQPLPSELPMPVEKMCKQPDGSREYSRVYLDCVGVSNPPGVQWLDTHQMIPDLEQRSRFIAEDFPFFCVNSFQDNVMAAQREEMERIKLETVFFPDLPG